MIVVCQQQFGRSLPLLKKSKLPTLFISFALLFTFSLTAQQIGRTVSGHVKDNDSNPVAAASIIVKGSSISTTTNDDGRYQVSAPDNNAVLVISHTSYETTEIPVGTLAILDVVLQSRPQSLGNVVVIGYGSQKRRNVTGSIVSLPTAQLETQPVGQIAQRIQGRMPGVQINQTSGQPGRGMSIRIRGAASINAGNTPLYVVDGFPIVGDINSIDPNEIENISVLKGPSAASIYGSRAANGVVLLTTKQAKDGKTSVQLNTNYGVGKVPQRGRPEMLNAKEFLQFEKELFEDRIRYEGYTGGVPALYQNPEQWTGPDTDWMDAVLRTSKTNSYNLTLLSAKDKFSTATNLGYYKEDGSVLNTGYERISLRSNNEYKVNDNIRIGLNIAPTYQSGQNFNTEGAYNFMFAVLTAPPIFSPYATNPNGSPVTRFEGPGLFTQQNWVIALEDAVNREKNIRVLANAFLDIDFLEDFKFRSAISVDASNSSNRVFNSSRVGSIFSAPPRIPSGSYATTNYISLLSENTITYKKTFAEDHKLDVLVGYSAQKSQQEYNNLSGSNFPDDLVPWIDAAAVRNGSNNFTEWSLLSMYSRLNYNFKGKYLLSASIRRDGSSRFGANNKWGLFPSLSAGWIVSDEDFMHSVPVLSYLKLRAEYGLTGNFNIGNYSQYGNVSTTNYVFGSALSQGRSLTSLGNSYLTWETTSGFGIGIDASILKDRITFTADYYQKQVDDMLYQVDIPSGTGFSNIQSNIGAFKFWGYEFAIGSRNLTGKLKWNTDFNISFNRNRVIQLGTNNTPIDGIREQSTYWKTEVGRPMGQFWGYVYDGVYMTQHEFNTQPVHVSSKVGTVRYKDLNGDGKITNEDRTYIGNPTPKYIFGMNNSLSYKSFDLSVVISGACGNEIINGQLEWGENQDGVFNVVKSLSSRWRSEADPGNGRNPRSTGAGTNFFRYANSRWIEDGSYLTIKNITLSYKLPRITDAFKSARVYLSCQQAAVFTQYNGMNPETSVNGLNGLREGVDMGSYPVPRTFAVGIDIIF
jgi:TonB-linked SusC/RagA family outer membrane protein